MSDIPLANVSSRYGAPMGRPSRKLDPDATPKLHLRRMPMVDGDYDAGGAYWGATDGHGGVMYCAWEDDGDDGLVFMRARNREEAKAAILEECPGATFYR